MIAHRIRVSLCCIKIQNSSAYTVGFNTDGNEISICLLIYQNVWVVVGSQIFKNF